MQDMYDPTGYILSRLDDLAGRVRAQEHETSDHSRRINSLESRMGSLQNLVSKWPYVVTPIMILVLNIAPKATIEAILTILKAAL